MENVKKPHVLETNNAQDPIWFKSTNHRSLKTLSYSRKRGKVVFDIHKKALYGHGMPTQLEAKAPLHYSIPMLSRYKIKCGNYNPGRCRSS